ncbi:hypothetical protein P3S67_023489 [Capsicum chacoense]
MRIRKHAKISPLLYTCSVFPGAHHCQLNQSPWDVITFQDDNINQQPLLVAPPLPPASSSYKLDGYYSYAVNETFCDSQQSITSMKLDDNGEARKMNFLDNNIADVPADCNDFDKDDEMVDGDNSVTTMCVKNDGKGWQCSREAKRGHNLCEHHFAQGKKHCSSNNSAQYSTTAAAAGGANSDTEIKQTVEVEAGPTPSSRGRPHRPKKSSSFEYYYYSGFGPLWGKKRGPSTCRKNNTTAPAAAENNSSHDSTTHGGQSSSPQMDNVAVEHVEDEDDDAEEVENCKLIKRSRKPIKARSLKSLM